MKLKKDLADAAHEAQVISAQDGRCKGNRRDQSERKEQEIRWGCFLAHPAAARPAAAALGLRARLRRHGPP